MCVLGTIFEFHICTIHVISKLTQTTLLAMIYSKSETILWINHRHGAFFNVYDIILSIIITENNRTHLNLT